MILFGQFFYHRQPASSYVQAAQDLVEEAMDGKVDLALEQGTDSKREKPLVCLDIGVVFGLGNN